jgi:hypothetical protein
MFADGVDCCDEGGAADARDPISGTAPHRAYLCEIRRVG